MTTTQTTLKQHVEGLIALISEGKILEAMDTYYADTIEMRENNEPPTVGLAANIEREKQFLAGVKAWHWTKWHAVAVNEADGVALIEYSFNFTSTEGQDITYEQATVQRWQDGKIISERFYHG
ncbi:MAG: nuclear transport factor 2 family protein [Planctomycetota bacterium]